MSSLRLGLMVLLSFGVAGGAAVLAMSRDTRPTEEQKAYALLRALGDTDREVASDAESQLRKFGPHALPALRGACGASDLRLARRARRLLDEMEGRSVPSTGTE